MCVEGCGGHFKPFKFDLNRLIKPHVTFGVTMFTVDTLLNVNLIIIFFSKSLMLTKR